MKRILCISDLHCPAHHPNTLPFLERAKKEFSPDRIVLLGDEVDGHAISFHDHDPDYPYSPSSELIEAKKTIKELYKLFPKADVLNSNHGSLVYRRASANGIPSICLRSWKEILETPNWNWHNILTIQTRRGPVSFHHGKSAAFLKWANAIGHSTVEGHYHTKFGVIWSGDKFSLKVGCSIDNEKLNFNYNKNNAEDVILGHAIILDGVPIMLPMN